MAPVACVVPSIEHAGPTPPSHVEAPIDVALDASLELRCRTSAGVRGTHLVVSLRPSIGYSHGMSLLAPTPADRMVDANGRPYFLWDEDLTIDSFRARLADPDIEVRAYYVGKLMRQAKPDDVFTFVTLREIKNLFPFLARYLGRSRDFWTWLLGRWNALPDVTE